VTPRREHHLVAAEQPLLAVDHASTPARRCHCGFTCRRVTLARCASWGGRCFMAAATPNNSASPLRIPGSFLDQREWQVVGTSNPAAPGPSAGGSRKGSIAGPVGKVGGRAGRWDRLPACRGPCTGLRPGHYQGASSALAEGPSAGLDLPASPGRSNSASRMRSSHGAPRSWCCRPGIDRWGLKGSPVDADTVHCGDSDPSERESTSETFLVFPGAGSRPLQIRTLRPLAARKAATVPPAAPLPITHQCRSGRPSMIIAGQRKAEEQPAPSHIDEIARTARRPPPPASPPS